MFHTIVSIKNDGHYFCRAGGNRPDGLNEPVTQKINAAQDLKWANEVRAKQAENLSSLEQDITNLEKAAALTIARMITYPR